MLTAAFIVLAAAVLLGAGLAVLHAREKGTAPAALGAAHALLGLGGLALLLLALRGPARGLGQGTAAFGIVGAALIAGAAAVGLTIFAVYRLRYRRAGTLIGIHATLAVGGFVILAAYVFA